jgi:flagellar basal body-associated protein FliL
MKSTIQTIISFTKPFTKFMGVLLVLTIVWQSVLLGGTEAITVPLVGTSTSSLSKEMSGKADEMKGNAKQKIGKMQSAMEDKKGEVKRKVKDDLTDAKIAIDGNNAKAKNAIDKAADSVKSFFGQ